MFASSVSDFFAPTFDAHYDRVYGLVLVGLDPGVDRDGIPGSGRNHCQSLGHLQNISKRKTHKHRQICGIVLGWGGCQKFVSVFFFLSGHPLWARKTT